MNLDRRVLWVFLLLSLIYYLCYFNYQLSLDDEGLLLWGASDIKHLWFPVADYPAYMPLSYFSLAGMFALFGNQVIVERIFLIMVLLHCGQMTLSVARRFLPGWWALTPAAIYALAPGPWYKVFFVWSVLIIAVAAFNWLDRPTLLRAGVFGLTTGIAAGCRIEAGVIGIVLALGMHVLLAADRALSREPVHRPNEILSFLFVVAGALLALSAWLPVYVLTGKLQGVLEFFRTDVFAFLSRKIVVHQGGMTLFDPVGLVRHPTLEQAFYAGGIGATLCVALPALRKVLSASAAERYVGIGRLTLVAIALGSMTYTFAYVWNSRMLSSFAVVYVVYCVAFMDIARAWTTKLRPSIGRLIPIFGTAVLMAAVWSFMAKIDFYSGSIVTRFRDVVEIAHPRLWGMRVGVGQVKDITRLMQELKSARPGATIVSMSEATTMGYLSGLPNPTRYRVFVREFGVPGEQARAIATFKRLKIDFFVARRSQFLPGGGFSSDLAAYAPKVRRFLVDHYQVVPLGRNFVLLRRRG